jgi:hypothetical protein
MVRLELGANRATLAGFARVREDVLAAARCQEVELVEQADLPDGVFAILGAELAAGPRTS